MGPCKHFVVPSSNALIGFNWRGSSILITVSFASDASGMPG